MRSYRATGLRGSKAHLSLAGVDDEDERLAVRLFPHEVVPLPRRLDKVLHTIKER